MIRSPAGLYPKLKDPAGHGVPSWHEPPSGRLTNTPDITSLGLGFPTGLAVSLKRAGLPVNPATSNTVYTGPGEHVFTFWVVAASGVPFTDNATVMLRH